MSQDIHGIVLAGGMSSRMGTDKALLPFEGQPLVDRICKQLMTVCMDVTVVLSRADHNPYRDLLPPNIRFTADHYPKQGPLAGLHAGLLSIDQGYGFVIACDMPYFSRSIFTKMLTMLDQEPLAVICSGQPFHGLYHKSAAAVAEKLLLNRQRKLQIFVNELAPLIYEPDEQQCFINLNNLEEYLQAMNKHV